MISLVVGGEITRNLDAATLRQRLSELLGPPPRAFRWRKSSRSRPVALGAEQRGSK